MKNVRKAVYYAIDKEALVKDVLSDGSEAINGLFRITLSSIRKLAKIFEKIAPLEGPDKPLHSLTGKKATADIGDKISIEMLTKDTDADKKVAEFIQGSVTDSLTGLDR